MSGFIFALTLRQQVLRRSTILLLLLALAPVLVAVIFRLADSDNDPQTWTAEVLYQNLVFTVLLPLTALIFGTSVIGDEIEEGTAIYLLAKPIQRWQILLPKLITPWLLTSVFTVISAVVAGSIAIDDGSRNLIVGAAAALALGAGAYTALFVLLSIATNHALIVGLIYIFIWEGLLAALFEGIRYLSIGHASLGMADWVAGRIPDTFEATVGGGTALALLGVATGAAAFLANQRLQRVEIRERV